MPYALVSLSTWARAEANAKLLRANLTFDSAACRHALRLAAALIVATILYRTLPGSHEYWIAIAALMVLRPDFDTTITRGLGRAGGTVTGAVLIARLARSNAEAAVERMAIEPDRPRSLTVEAADGIVAGVHRFALATVAINASRPASHPPLAGLVPLRDGITATLTSLADRLAGQSGPVESDLRRLHAGLVEALSQAGGGQAGVNHPRKRTPFQPRWPSSSGRPTSWSTR